MPQTHSTIRDGKRLVWYTEGLWEHAKELIPFEICIEEIAELDQDCWFARKVPTLREMAIHLKRIESADLRFPIILNDDGSLMDGGHRICKVVMRGNSKIQAVQFRVMPKPDEIHDLRAILGRTQVGRRPRSKATERIERHRESASE